MPYGHRKCLGEGTPLKQPSDTPETASRHPPGPSVSLLVIGSAAAKQRGAQSLGWPGILML